MTTWQHGSEQQPHHGVDAMAFDRKWNHHVPFLWSHPCVPSIHFNKDIFPGTRQMMTLHLEATQNGIMLIAMALMMPWLNLSKSTTIIYEVASNLGAWCDPHCGCHPVSSRDL
jgi:hypothetical protein